MPSILPLFVFFATAYAATNSSLSVPSNIAPPGPSGSVASTVNNAPAAIVSSSPKNLSSPVIPLSIINNNTFPASSLLQSSGILSQATLTSLPVKQSFSLSSSPSSPPPPPPPPPLVSSLFSPLSQPSPQFITAPSLPPSRSESLSGLPQTIRFSLPSESTLRVAESSFAPASVLTSPVAASVVSNPVPLLSPSSLSVSSALGTSASESISSFVSSVFRSSLVSLSSPALPPIPVISPPTSESAPAVAPTLTPIPVALPATGSESVSFSIPSNQPPSSMNSLATALLSSSSAALSALPVSPIPSQIVSSALSSLPPISFPRAPSSAISIEPVSSSPVIIVVPFPPASPETPLPPSMDLPSTLPASSPDASFASPPSTSLNSSLAALPSVILPSGGISTVSFNPPLVSATLNSPDVPLPSPIPSFSETISASTPFTFPFPFPMPTISLPSSLGSNIIQDPSSLPGGNVMPPMDELSTLSDPLNSLTSAIIPPPTPPSSFQSPPLATSAPVVSAPTSLPSLITTSQLPRTLSSTDARGSTFITTFTPSASMVLSLIITTEVLANGQTDIITRYDYVYPTPMGALDGMPGGNGDAQSASSNGSAINGPAQSSSATSNASLCMRLLLTVLALSVVALNI